MDDAVSTLAPSPDAILTVREMNGMVLADDPAHL